MVKKVETDQFFCHILNCKDRWFHKIILEYLESKSYAVLKKNFKTEDKRILHCVFINIFN